MGVAADRLVREPGAEGLANPSSRTGLAASPQMGIALPPGVSRP